MGLKQPHWVAGSLIASNTTRYLQPLGHDDESGQSTEANATLEVDAPGTIRNLRVVLGTVPGGTATRTFTFRKGAADQSVTVTLGSADTTQSDTSNSFTVVAGDTLTIRQAGTNTPAATAYALVYEWETADTVTSHYSIGNQDNTLGTSGTPMYAPLFSAGGASAWNSVAARADAIVAVAGTITSARFRLSAAPGSGKSRTCVIEKNDIPQDGTGGTPDTTITISDSATSGTASFVLSVAATDRVRYKETAVGTPTNARVIGTHTFVATTAGQMCFCATPDDAPSGSSTEYSYGIGGPVLWNATESARQLPGPVTSIALSGLYAFVDVAMSGSAAHAYTLRLNGSDTAQTVTIVSSTSAAGPSGGALVTLTSSDVFAMKVVTTLGASTNRPHLAFLMTDPTAAVSTFNALLIAP